MDYRDLDVYFSSNHKAMRILLAALALAFPPIVIMSGYEIGSALQSALSAYYWVGGAARVAFIAILSVIGVLLVMYRGFSREEDHVLNVAGACALLVAWVPMPWANGEGFRLHNYAASLLFICLAYVMWFRAKDTLALQTNEISKRRYWRAYNVLSLCMLVTPFLAWVFNILLPGSHYTLFTEIFGIYSFAAYWLVKINELDYED